MDRKTSFYSLHELIEDILILEDGIENYPELTESIDEEEYV